MSATIEDDVELPPSEADGWARVGRLEELQEHPCNVVAGKPGIALFCTADRVFAVDNRCPHMGFPLSRGSVQNGILTCHWHHARFDLESGGTFDPFADDVRVYPTRVVDGEVWVNTRPPAGDQSAHWKKRLADGLEQNISLVTAKAVLALLEADVPPRDILSIGGSFGARFRRQGWGPGLTILTAMANVLPHLDGPARMRALWHGMVHVADDVAGAAPHFPLDPLPTRDVPPERLKSWFRRFVEVRDVEGAERTLLTAIHGGMDAPAVADMMLAACTDHYFLAGGHTLDFINKAFEYLDQTDWAEAETILSSLVRGLCMAQRSEELNSWRNPIDLVELLEPVLGGLDETVRGAASQAPQGDLFAELVPVLLGEDPAASVAVLMRAIEQGWRLDEIAGVLAYAAALRIARFHTSNEFSDWITVLHTFSYCNALHHSLQRAPSAELARGIFHGAMRLYLDRYLNMPAARLPDAATTASLPGDAHDLLTLAEDLLDREQQVNRAGDVTWRYLAQGHDDSALLARLGYLLLREDAEFHSYQMLEAGTRQYLLLRRDRPKEAAHVLIAVARYLAAHAPTSRAMLQTARNALRLARGEALWEGDA